MAAKVLLTTLAAEIKSNPNFKLAVGTANSAKKADVNLSWQRVKAVIDFLVEHEGISAERIVFGYDLGEVNIVELEVKDDNSSSIPIPNRRH